eukprot:scaffold5440_cov196-Pinguiococcus_pyrenoidosus.AAC.1
MKRRGAETREPRGIFTNALPHAGVIYLRCALTHGTHPLAAGRRWPTPAFHAQALGRATQVTHNLLKAPGGPLPPLIGPSDEKRACTQNDHGASATLAISTSCP